MTNRKRPPAVIWITPIVFALACFYRVTQSPSFEMYRTVDIVQLLATGVCLGAAMVGIVVSVVRGRN